MRNTIIKILEFLIKIFKKKELTINVELMGGLLWIGEKDTDYLFGSSQGLKDAVRERGNINRWVVYEYNQWAQYETRNWCTIYSAVTEVSWLMNYKYSLDEILHIGHKMIRDKKLNPNKGAFLHSAIDYVRRDWNERFPERQIESYQVDYSDDEFVDYLDKHMTRITQLGYRTSWILFKEIQSTWGASKKDYPKNWGHAVSMWGHVIINNYYNKRLGNKFYVNRFKFDDIPALVDNKVIFRIGYMFLKKMD